MMIIDKALEQRHAADNPIRVAMVGAGFMARGIALQFFSAVRGMKLVAISNRNLHGAIRAYAEAGITDVELVENVTEMEDAIAKGRYAVTEDALLLAMAEGIDVIIEVTGTVEYASHVVLKAIQHEK